MILIAMMIACCGLLYAAIGWWADAPMRNLVKGFEQEPDPLKELEAAHRMELSEWDNQFLTLTGKYVDPPQNQLHVPGLRDAFQTILKPGLTPLQSAMMNQRQLTQNEYIQQQMLTQHMSPQELYNQAIQQHNIMSQQQSSPFGAAIGQLGAFTLEQLGGLLNGRRH